MRKVKIIILVFFTMLNCIGMGSKKNRKQKAQRWRMEELVPPVPVPKIPSNTHKKIAQLAACVM